LPSSGWERADPSDLRGYGKYVLPDPKEDKSLGVVYVKRRFGRRARNVESSRKAIITRYGKDRVMKRAGLMFVMVAVMVAVSAGVAVAAVKFGTDGRDFLRGTGDPDVLYGEGGSDVLVGKGDDDVLYGGDGRDYAVGGKATIEANLRGPSGEDKIFGGDGPDCVFGGTEDDILYGGDGSDLIGLFCIEFISDTGNDIMYGGSGRDFIIAVDRNRKPERDIVSCGSGTDDVFADRLDRISDDCENVSMGGF